MARTGAQLREDAVAIWKAGVAAVDSQRLVSEHLHVRGNTLVFEGGEIDLNAVRRLVVVGAGKAGAGMAKGLEEILGESLMQRKQLWGWINVPADCVRQLSRITLHAARPAGVNEPTRAGVEGSQRILGAVSSCDADDLCICLLSGGGSALLPAPIEGVRLEDKLAITRHLSAAGANIEELNTVRKQLSKIKGGGLARACSTSRVLTLIISDVIGDPLDVIASGPTIDDSSTPQAALDVLEKFQAREAGISPTIFDLLRSAPQRHQLSLPTVDHVVIGNNATAVDAAGMEAERRGYSHAMAAARDLEGPAEGVGRHLAKMALHMRSHAGPDCLITGGEPTVTLVDARQRGQGGRNQQLALAALEALLARNPERAPADALKGIALLAGGTDGEDGPTDAAGAIVNQELAARMQAAGVTPADFLRRNDAYNFFDPLDGLLRTGATHTNVCDVRVVTVDPPG